MDNLSPETGLDGLSGIGPYYKGRLKKLNITRVSDFLYHPPSRYLDLSIRAEINSLQEGETVTIKGLVKDIKLIRAARKHLTLQKAQVEDSTGSITVTWFNQPYLVTALRKREVYLAGTVTRQGNKLTLTSPEYEIDKGQDPTHTGRLVPIYPQTAGISSKWLRTKITQFLPLAKNLPDPLSTIAPRNLPVLSQALISLHQPKSQDEFTRARSRLAFDELFTLQLVGLFRRKTWKLKKHVSRITATLETDYIKNFITSLPFKLTPAQLRSTSEILNDLNSSQAMNRILQGDVGSGKTVVAAIAAFALSKIKLHTIFMCPTEILAFQHFQTLNSLLNPHGITTSLLTGSQKKILPKSSVTVGTHALLHQKINKHPIGLVIIDEQHRFGVEQRSQLQELAGTAHLLTMTATPIPRTVALTFYGELEMSIIDQMPPGRKSVKTYVVTPEKFSKALNWIRGKIKQGHLLNSPEQAYIIYPLIEESEKLIDVKAVTNEYQKLTKGVFNDLKVALLHGKMPSQEKEKILTNFRQLKFDILMSTPVVEVGVDIPNATIIVIEEAQRFGLAQLHQLRGRVGRNDRESYCLLLTPAPSKRLFALNKIHSGLKLAELDLKYRGSGDLYGTRQHGVLETKFADLSDVNLVSQTHHLAETLLSQDPDLINHPLLLKKIKENLTKSVNPN